MRIPSVVGVILILGGASAPPTAFAHPSTTPAATVFRDHVVRITPPQPELRVVVLDGDRRLRLSWRGGGVVVVSGVLGEPVLRITPAGAWINDASPSAQVWGLTSRGRVGAVSAAGPVSWRRVAAQPVIAWHDHRLAPVGVTATVTQIRIPLLVNGRAVTVAIDRQRGADPPVAFLVAAVLALAFVPVAAARRVSMIASALALTAAAAALVGAVGGLLAEPRTAVSEAALLTAAALIFVLAALGVRWRPHRRVVSCAVALTAGYVTVGQAAVLTDPYPNSALPDALARLVVVLALGCGAGGALTAAAPWIAERWGAGARPATTRRPVAGR